MGWLPSEEFVELIGISGAAGLDDFDALHEVVVTFPTNDVLGFIVGERTFFSDGHELLLEPFNVVVCGWFSSSWLLGDLGVVVLFQFGFSVWEAMLNEFLADFAQFVEDVLALLGCGGRIAVPRDIFSFSQAIKDISHVLSRMHISMRGFFKANGAIFG
jgi:hypothetical protein